ncbi:hypothetical protein BDV38DRAFT_246116 [Aspergillus pseudotamarii]|uniref:Uncharacterized protein n=1 Tax=Aspergillus pseudotamarii TaxID=132259 RepID=A0A5N6SX66_ASPPS|nr:uncharacterized protein BDV38DRAFT_246116 [Aspergillus pseudotamarii]KAE8137724.1 hypothetical protein BDV38DRAFT_246116 [Aspergillus pseudotamarii]
MVLNGPRWVLWGVSSFFFLFPSLYLDFLRGARTRSGPFFFVHRALLQGRHEPRRSLHCFSGSFLFSVSLIIDGLRVWRRPTVLCKN